MQTSAAVVLHAQDFKFDHFRDVVVRVQRIERHFGKKKNIHSKRI